jgi:hypothetical protein
MRPAKFNDRTAAHGRSRFRSREDPNAPPDDVLFSRRHQMLGVLLQMTVAILRVAGKRWAFDETEWLILRLLYEASNSPSGAMRQFFGAGGAFEMKGIGVVTLFVRSLAQRAKEALVVGTDKYPGLSNWNKRWRAVLSASNVAFESRSRMGNTVFRVGRT